MRTPCSLVTDGYNRKSSPFTLRSKESLVKKSPDLVIEISSNFSKNLPETKSLFCRRNRSPQVKQMLLESYSEIHQKKSAYSRDKSLPSKEKVLNDTKEEGNKILQTNISAIKKTAKEIQTNNEASLKSESNKKVTIPAINIDALNTIHSPTRNGLFSGLHFYSTKDIKLINSKTRQTSPLNQKNKKPAKSSNNVSIKSVKAVKAIHYKNSTEKVTEINEKGIKEIKFRKVPLLNLKLDSQTPRKSPKINSSRNTPQNKNLIPKSRNLPFSSFMTATKKKFDEKIIM